MITHAIIFDHRGRSKAGAEGPVELRVTIDRKPYYINTGVKVRGRELRDGRIVDRADAAYLNEQLKIMVQRMLAGVNRCLAAELPIDVAEIRRQAYKSAETTENAKTAMLDWIEKEVPRLPIGEGTKMRYYTLINRLKEYKELTAWGDLSVDAIYKWDGWLHTIRRPESKADKQSGRLPDFIGDAAVYNYHRTLKSLLSRAVKVEKIENNPYDRVRGEFRKGIKENMEYLTEEEIAAIESLRPMEGTQMAMARDLFVFQLYTGMSYADAEAFDIDEYRKIDGTWRAVSERIKTGVAYVSELLPQAVEVLERYGMQTPQMINIKYNDCLKVIQQACGVRTRLHSHLARHTFATRMLRMGAKIENVSKMLGHTNITQTQRYAKVIAESVHEDYEKMKERLEAKTAGKP